MGEGTYVYLLRLCNLLVCPCDTSIDVSVILTVIHHSLNIGETIVFPALMQTAHGEVFGGHPS